jgi:drug/metabolite transporter (DMT)-like permease
MLLIIFLYALLASTFTLGKAALFYVKPFFFISIRMIPGGVLLLGYLYFFKRSHFVLHKKDWFLYCQTILFHIYAAFMLEFWALQYLASSKACLLYNTAPFFSAIFSYLVFREHITARKLFGLIIGFLGFLPILLSEGAQERTEGTMLGFSWAEIALLGSVIAATYGWILMRTLVRERSYSPIMVNGVAMVGGGILAAATSYYVEAMPILVPSWHGIGMGIFYTALMIIIANIIFYNLYGYLLQQYSATFLAFAGFICPLFAALYGWLFLDEYIGWAYISSSTFVFLGLYFFYKEELKLRS